MIGRPKLFKQEIAFWKKCYEIGMQNGWCSGKYAIADGDYIVEEDRLNKDSVCVIDTVRELIKFFKEGNWCLGQAVIHKNLCFIQQVNGGDEWLTMKEFSDGIVRSFESISFGRMIEDKDNLYEFIEDLKGAVVIYTTREFVKTDKEGEIVRGKDGLALTEEKDYLEISYGRHLKKDMKGMYGIIAV
jgi:hypothetical protein